MATMTTAEEYIRQHPNDSFEQVLGEDIHKPTANEQWASMIQVVYSAWLNTKNTITLDEVSLAIYTYWTDPVKVPDWADRVTSAQLIAVLTGLKQPGLSTSAFDNTDGAITAAVNKHYLDIQITVDVDGISDEYGTGPGCQNINQFVTMKDNHKSTSSGENTDELNSEGLLPDMTITWTAVSNPRGYTITLTRFMSNSISTFTDLAPEPVSLPGSPNIKVTKAKSTLPTSSEAQYSWYLTISGFEGSYYFDPFIGDGIAKTGGDVADYVTKAVDDVAKVADDAAKIADDELNKIFP